MGGWDCLRRLEAHKGHTPSLGRAHLGRGSGLPSSPGARCPRPPDHTHSSPRRRSCQACNAGLPAHQSSPALVEGPGRGAGSPARCPRPQGPPEAHCPGPSPRVILPEALALSPHTGLPGLGAAPVTLQALHTPDCWRHHWGVLSGPQCLSERGPPPSLFCPSSASHCLFLTPSLGAAF